MVIESEYSRLFLTSNTRLERHLILTHGNVLRGRLCLVSVIGVLFAGWVAPLHGQSGSDDWTAPQWVGDVTFVGANALMSGLSAGILQRLRGGSFSDGLTRGALGGSVQYAGKRIAAQHFDGAGLLGRQVSATGISIVRNAADGRPSLDRLLFPLGPLHLYVQLSDGIAVRPKINLTALIVAVSAAAQPELRWDADATLSAGAPVFHAPGRSVISGKILDGYVKSGSIVLSDIPSPEYREQVLAHERVHVLQGDWLFQVWSDPAESWTLKKVPGGSTLYRYLDIDFVAGSARSLLYRAIGVRREKRFSEIEAGFLEHR